MAARTIEAAGIILGFGFVVWAACRFAGML